MARKKLLDAFDIKEEKVVTKPVADYEIFKDKELLDNLRNTIISNLIDDKIPNNKLLHEYINDEIDKALLGYDLTNLERSHIFNLIDNEINGYGPITELLEDSNITEIMVNGKNEVYVEIEGQDNDGYKPSQFFQINYCPMCGRKLGGLNNE